ncbi:MAG: hypothetical protein CFE44_12625 [Burkholderiales bacterium PBB4]|nr:MAG: hypothetical protein CFE44_12625 [Burkholderiales bacterium PBB4]
MSIDRLNHLRFPAETSLPTRAINVIPAELAEASTDAASSEAGAANAAVPRLTARVPTLSERIEPPLVSVVVHLPTEAAAATPTVEPVGYGNVRKPVTAATPEASEQLDLVRMEAAHQRAQARSAHTVTALSVDPQGIVVSRQPDFVSVAVSAMREFKDEAERQKRYAQVAAAPSTPAAQAAGLRGLASRLNLFA